MSHPVEYKIGRLTFIESELETKPIAQPKSIAQPKPEPLTKISLIPFPPCTPQRLRPTGLWFIEG